MKAVETLWGTVALKAHMMSTTRCSGLGSFPPKDGSSSSSSCVEPNEQMGDGALAQWHSVHDLNLCKNYTSALLTLRLGVVWLGNQGRIFVDVRFKTVSLFDAHLPSLALYAQPTAMWATTAHGGRALPFLFLGPFL